MTRCPAFADTDIMTTGDHMVTDRMMEQVYRLIPIVGLQRAFAEVAGLRFDESTESFEPDTATALELRERFTAEMEQFHANGGF
jgi:hypothetical protein